MAGGESAEGAAAGTISEVCWLDGGSGEGARRKRAHAVTGGANTVYFGRAGNHRSLVKGW